MDENAFERMVADQELERLLDNEDWVPDDDDMRRFRAFNASRELIAEAQQRQARGEDV